MAANWFLATRLMKHEPVVNFRIPAWAMRFSASTRARIKSPRTVPGPEALIVRLHNSCVQTPVLIWASRCNLEVKKDPLQSPLQSDRQV